MTSDPGLRPRGQARRAPSSRPSWRVGPSRLRPLSAALAGVAVLGVTLPVHDLFTPNDWFRVTTLLILVVTIGGTLLRLVLRPAALVAACQLLIVAWLLPQLLLGSTTRWTLPTRATYVEAQDQLRLAAKAIARSAAPVPLEPGIVLGLALVVAVLAVTVDVLAVTLRMPAAAGLALLAAFVATAANSGTGLALGYFLVPALAWVGLLGHDGIHQVRRWGGSIARSPGRHERDAAGSLLNAARVLAAVGMVAALALPGILPHFPTTFLADGLGRAKGARGAGAGVLNSSLDVSRNLLEQSDDVVLTYTSTVTPPPLRVDVLTTFAEGSWAPSTAEAYDTDGRLPSADQSRGATTAPGIPRRTGVLQAADNGLRPPQIALPGAPTALDLPKGSWQVDAAGVVRVAGAHERYAVTFEDLSPRVSDFGTSGASGRGPADAVAVDEAARVSIDRVLAEIAPPDLSAGESARAIQAYLRSSRFTYSVELAPARALDDQGQPVASDPVSQFLATRRGYCVQFATAMTLMARQRGIPARVAIGFLPGAKNGDTWTVRGKDAHAWPELWFPEVGWLRFEPTPGIRTGFAPGWSIDSTTAAPSPPAAAPTAAPAEPREQPAAQPASTNSGNLLTTAVRWLDEHRVPLLAFALILLGVAATPLAARAARRRDLRRARAEDERVEVLWQSMLSRLDDVGLRPEPGDTPRVAGQRIAQAGHLDDSTRASMDTAVSTLERVRYRPNASTVSTVSTGSTGSSEHLTRTMSQAADAVVTTVRSRRQPVARARALLLPSEGVAAWSRVGRWLVRMPGRLLRRSQSR